MTDEAVAFVPIGQSYSFTVTPGPSRILRVETIGGLLCEIDRLFGKESTVETGERHGAYLTGIARSEDGEIRIEFEVLPVETEAAE
jgi:hypothetical protein